jgi:tripartite-type tricarboxylate transporter receptor subunit TctC
MTVTLTFRVVCARVIVAKKPGGTHEDDIASRRIRDGVCMRASRRRHRCAGARLPISSDHDDRAVRRGRPDRLTLGRILSERMRASLGETIVIENVTGAGSTIGVGRAAQATPDGYTLALGNWTSFVGSGALYRTSYDLRKDFEPVSLLTFAPMLIVGKSTLPVKDAKELIAWLKASPDKVSAATVGAGSAAHVCGLYFQDKTHTRFQFVPYRGGAPAIQDLVGGQIDLMCAEASQTLTYVRGGKIKAFAVMAHTRWPALPDVPTTDEIGTPGMYISFWHGLWVPKATPKAVIAKLNTAVVDTLADPTVRQRLTDLGQVIATRDQQTPAALAAYHKAEIEKWWPIIKAANIQVEGH